MTNEDFKIKTFQPYIQNINSQNSSPPIITPFIEDILAKVSARIAKPINEWKVLDVGCGQGHYTHEISKHVKRVVAVEPCYELFQAAEKLNKNTKNTTVHNCLIENFSSEEEFDLVLSITTVEHMPNANQSFAKVLSMMKSGAVLFLTAPNKLWPIEPHYGLPFLSWLPLPLANVYLRISGNNHSYKSCSYSKTYWGMKRLFKYRSCSLEFILPDLSKGYVGLGNSGILTKAVQKLGVKLISRMPIFWIFSKGFIILVTKK